MTDERKAINKLISRAVSIVGEKYLAQFLSLLCDCLESYVVELGEWGFNKVCITIDDKVTGGYVFWDKEDR